MIFMFVGFFLKLCFLEDIFIVQKAMESAEEFIFLISFLG